MSCLNPHIYLAQLCAEAYTISNRMPGFAWFKFDNIVVVSGTDHWSDWVDNFNFYPFTARGFHKTYLKYSSEIISSLDPDTQYTFTGHSAGGQIAEICAIATGGNSITFGSPTFYSKIGFTKNFNSYRYVLKFDPVARIRYSVYSEPLANTIVLPGFGHHINKYIRALK